MVNGRVSGRVLLPDGGPARDATVFLDASFQTLGESDNKSMLEVSAEVQDEKGEWKRIESPPLPKHVPFSTRTDGEGRYVFAPAPDLDEVLDRHPIKVWATRDEAVAPLAVLRCESRAARVPDLVLGSAIRPRVLLKTLDGAAVGDAYVDVWFRVPDEFGHSREDLLYWLGARTDAEGLGTLPRIQDRPDWQAWLSVNPNDMPRHIETRLPIDRLRTGLPLEIRISRGFLVRGRVLLPDGRPGSNVTVSSRQPSDPDPNPGHSTQTSADGSFELRGVPARDAILTFVLPPDPRRRPTPGLTQWSSGPVASLTRPVNGREGKVTEIGDVRLGATLSIEGIVLDASGKPARSGYVMLDGIGQGHHVGPNGHFEIPGVERGRHTLVASIFEGSGPFEGELKATLPGVEAGAKDVTIRVTGGGNLVVRFHPVGKSNELLEVFRPRLLWGPFGGGGGEKATEIRMDLAPGRRADLRVEAEGYRPRLLGPIEILTDRKTVIDIELEPSK